MKRKLLNIIILTLIFSDLAFAQSNFISDYNIIDIKPIETNIIVPFITNLQTNSIFSNSIFKPGTNIYSDDFTHRFAFVIKKVPPILGSKKNPVALFPLLK